MKRILIVEDDKDFATQCVELLLENQFEVGYFSNAEKAKLDILRADYDVALIDLMLPPTFSNEGIELFRYMQSVGRAKGVVFMTVRGSGTTEIVAEAMKIGAKDFLDKNNPLFFDKLLLTLEEINRELVEFDEKNDNEDIGSQSESASYLSSLYDIIVERFEKEELYTLCFKLGVDYDSLRGQGKADNVRELILLMMRSERLDNLMDELRKERPFVRWPDKPSSFNDTDVC